MDRRDFLKVAVSHKRSKTIDFPDFTRGGWTSAPPLPIVHM